METQRISLETSTVYELTDQELRKMYIYMALNRLRQQRNPNYNEINLLKDYYFDIKKKYTLTQKLVANNRDSKITYNLNLDFNQHFIQLRKVLKNEGIDPDKISEHKFDDTTI